MDINKKKATTFVILLGCISLFADMTYESARSINGQYLEVLGTSGTTVGWVAGLGELLGYGLRIVSGYFADKTKKYWLIAISGYIINLLSVPLLALAGYWQLAVVLMILERIGKALRTPSRDAMLSFGASQMGSGWGFGLHEAMDQTGATVGPLLIALALYAHNNNYKIAYAFLAIPAIIAITILLVASSLYPNPSNLEIKNTSLVTKGYPKLFWLYILSTVFIALGYADFPLMAYHFKSHSIMNDETIPIFYAIAMAAEGLVALLLGKLFDKLGITVLIVASFIAFFFAPLVFRGNFFMALIGVIIWGIGMGAQESVMKAIVAEMLPAQNRGKGFGLFNTAFGTFWFTGSFIMGRLYDISINRLILFSVITQLIAVILLVFLIDGKALKILKVKQNIHT
ncbi:MFS transporter [Arachidicoccus ginsenosidimutans]|uniref:MFS transporter n=1 Tax=Arachidicoccus sp. BS20 TaxID=1850526 RepID=UPI0007F0FD4B|nr:MFS transporter [Arachidicoccus sp. BS20]ANI88956.1 MFS transporter [Arachidicoccus sp. BS20]